jgi:5-methylcytosine-specific restriction protein A
MASDVLGTAKLQTSLSPSMLVVFIADGKWGKPKLGVEVFETAMTYDVWSWKLLPLKAERLVPGSQILFCYGKTPKPNSPSEVWAASGMDVALLCDVVSNMYEDADPWPPDPVNGWNESSLFRVNLRKRARWVRPSTAIVSSTVLLALQESARTQGSAVELAPVDALTTARSMNSSMGSGLQHESTQAPVRTNKDTLIASTRNPPWTQDELILAMDLYIRLGHVDARHPETILLSEILNRLPIHSTRPDKERFRNPNGVNLKLANFAAIDPSNPGKGMVAGSKLDRAVWERFHDRLVELRALAKQLTDIANNPTDELCIPVDDEEEVVEGRIVFRRHRARERNQTIVKKKRETVKRETGALKCEVCLFDFLTAYGKRGDGFIKVHHLVPLASDSGKSTKISDLAVLCANCHRMIHRSEPWLTPKGLRLIMTGLA